MGLRRCATTSVSGSSPLHCLRVLLLLFLLLAALAPATTGQSKRDLGKSEATGIDPYAELRCVCLSTVSGIQPNAIISLELIRPGVHCEKVELIATLKDGRKICLEPGALGIKKMVLKLLDR